MLSSVNIFHDADDMIGAFAIDSYDYFQGLASRLKRKNKVYTIYAMLLLLTHILYYIITFFDTSLY